MHMIHLESWKRMRAELYEKTNIENEKNSGIDETNNHDILGDVPFICGIPNVKNRKPEHIFMHDLGFQVSRS